MRLKQRAALAATLAIACLFTIYPAGARARTYHRTLSYELAGETTKTNRADPTCDARGRNCRLSPDGGFDVGGVVFPPVGGRGSVNILLTVKDAINPFGRVKIEACEDADEDGSCTAATSFGGDRRIVYTCLTAKQTAKLFKISRALPVIVYVYAAWGCPRYLDDASMGLGGGTAGSITETWTS